MRSLFTLAMMLLMAGTAYAETLRIEHEKYTLANGLEVILHEDHSTPIVAVDVWYHVGSKNERPGRSGFAHLFEHMMFQGSEHQDGEFFGPLLEVGGSSNGSTNTDRTNYWEIVPSNHLERAILLEADRMGWLLPAMTQEKLDNQRDVVRNERRQSEGSPYSVLWMNMNREMYPKGHPYDHSVIGEHEDLEAASMEDVQDFFRTYYVPNNATLSIAGDFDPAQAKAWIEQYFGEIPPGPPVVETQRWIPEIEGEKRVRMEDRVQLRRIAWCWFTPPAYEGGTAEMSLAAGILGQGKSSRLYKRLIQETALAQEVSVSQDDQEIVSEFSVSVTLRDESDQAEVERIVQEELDRFAKSGPSADELERAQTAEEASFLRGIQQVGSWGGKADLLNRYNHYVGTPDYLAQDMARFQGATVASVRETFAKWIGPDRFVFEVHPLGTLEAMAAAELDRTVLPAGGPAPAFQIPQVEESTLENGLQLMTLEQNELPLVEVRLVIGAGKSADPLSQSGLADLAAAMLTEGAGNLDAAAFTDRLDELGAQLGVWTSLDYTTLSLTALAKNLDPSMALLADALLRPSVAPDQLERVVDRRIIDVEREGENSWAVVGKATRKVVFGEGHPYRSSPTKESLSSISDQDVKKFIADRYTPQHATLIMVGDIRPEEATRLAQRHLGTWKGAALAPVSFSSGESNAGRAIYLIDKPGDSQSTISIVHAAPGRGSEDWTRLDVANRALGGMFVSRINLNLREDKGYSYGVRSSFADNREAGMFSMGGRVQTEVTAPALVELLKELDGIHGKRPLTEDELRYSKDSIIQGYPTAFETIGGLANAFATYVGLGLPLDELVERPAKVESVTLAEANAAGQEFFLPEQAKIVVVGDLAKIEASIRDLDLGPIHHLDREGNAIAESQTGESVTP